MSDVFKKGKSAAPATKGSGKFVKVSEDESLAIVPLVELDELTSVDQHEFWDVNPAVLFPCIGEGCPACEAGNKPKYKAFLPVMSTDGESKIFAFGISIERQIEEISEETGGIKGMVLKIRRSGSGFSTRYTVVATGKKVKAEITPLAPEHEITVLTAEEIRGKMDAMRLGSSDSSDEKPAAKKKSARKAEPETGSAEWEEV